MNRIKILTMGVLVFVLNGGSMEVFAQEGMENERIGFYKIALTSRGAELIQVDTTPGRLKKRRHATAPRGPYFFTVTTAAGDELWKEGIGDPLTEPLEYIDDNGNLAVKALERDSVVVYLRSPLLHAGGTLNVFHLDTFAPGVASKAPRLVGSFHITID